MNVLVDMYIFVLARSMGGRVKHIGRGLRLFFYFIRGLRSP